MTLTLNNTNLNQVKQIKILGLTLDNKLTWKSHIEDLKAKCNQKFKLLKILAAKKLGRRRKNTT